VLRKATFAVAFLGVRTNKKLLLRSKNKNKIQNHHLEKPRRSRRID
jgi:hypothetical protein